MVLSLSGGRITAANPSGPMLSECDGSIREIVIQYVAGADMVVPVYRDFLSQLPADVQVDVVCPDQTSFDELRERLHEIDCALHPILTGHAMTAWSRDRWVALTPNHPGDSITLLTPKEESAADVWPARAGDERIAFDLANQLAPRIVASRSPLAFDGGDLLADSNSVFVTGALIHRNVGVTVSNRAQLLAELRSELRRNIVLLDDCPDHHAGMFMMAVADHTMLIADPSLAALYGQLDSASFPALPGGPDLSDKTRQKLNAIAAQCQALGYKVVRIPTLPANDGKTYLTYVNVITDLRAGRRIVYLPIYRGAESLNDAAERVWREIGYEVHPVDCTSTYTFFGNLHCLVNVLRR